MDFCELLQAWNYLYRSFSTKLEGILNRQAYVSLELTGTKTYTKFWKTLNVIKNCFKTAVLNFHAGFVEIGFSLQ